MERINLAYPLHTMEQVTLPAKTNPLPALDAVLSKDDPNYEEKVAQQKAMLKLDTFQKQKTLDNLKKIESGELVVEPKKAYYLSWQKDYKLAEVGTHNFAYQPKEPGDDAVHNLCPTCFIKGAKSLMMLSPNPPARLFCGKCNTTVRLVTHLDAPPIPAKQEESQPAVVEDALGQPAAVQSPEVSQLAPETNPIAG